MIEKCFIHVDLDAFYASVEQLDNPQYKGKPVIVGGLPSDKRGVVSTCSYEARAYGVHSAMPIVSAVKLCPHAIFLRGRMKRYQEKSKEIMSIFSDFSPDVQQISVDEAFIDITGTERLFGKPKDLAHKLQQRVLEQTGLTVSIGISSTKYIAKIASGIKKPNGLYIVEPGKEEDFMLQLPLKDIWGIGQRTIARIKEAGFFSPQDIHKASNAMLISLFGNATGTFLFNAVRGQLFDTFNEAPKSRSISSERTFSVDLTDRYAIDTALMELSWDVMYRIFTEKWTSKTAHVKIRYEDFTTVSIQETTPNAISSADDLFVRVKRLFEKKYENGRGIRLIGIAAQNLEDKSIPTQQDLFEADSKKKIAVEKTVIEMQRKNPHLQIKKARLLKTFLTFLFITLTTIQQGFTQNNDVITLNKPFEDAFISGEAPIAMFNLSANSQQVEFFSEGTWEAMLTGFLNVSNNQDNAGAISLSFAPPVFIQKTDLSVWFLLQDTWYFEANIADEYDESTVAAGYYGNNILRHARVGNRNITFSQNYGVTDANKGVGSGSNQSPGIMAEWEGNNWKADAIVRYDMIESMEKTWIGQYEANENIIQLTDWQRGARFVFPQNTLQTITDIYVESKNTDTTLYTDNQGITYRRLSTSEYLLIPNKNMLVLSTPTDNAVLVSFQAKPQLGSFTEKNTFLGEVQSHFGNDINLANYSIADSGEDFFTQINGFDALIVQADNFFSPFLDASLYSLSSFSKVDSVAIISESSGVTVDEYGVVLLNSSSLEVPHFTENDIFNESNTYIQLFNQSQKSNNLLSRFPLADAYPLVYLTPNSSIHLTQNQSDTVISVQSLTSSSALDIGTDAISGSITVYRNGIKESLYKYDATTGLIHLTSPIGTFDTIRITWNQNTETSSNGSLTLAAGFEKELSENLSMNVSSSVLWPIMNEDAFIDSSFDASGSVNLALHANYKQENIEINNTLISSLQLSDVTETYLIDGMNSNDNETLYLSQDADIALPSHFEPIINPRPGETTASSKLQDLLMGNIESNTIRDSEQGEYIVNTDWEITENNGWIAQSIDLGTRAANLSSAKTFSLQIKQPNLPDGSKMYVQLGVSKDEENLVEKNNEIPTWEITSIDINSDVVSPFDSNNNLWQDITIQLTNEDRSKLSINQNLRIIIESPQITRGTLQVGSFELTYDSFSTTGDIISKEVRQAESKKIELPEMKRFNPEITNFVHYFNWNTSLNPNTLSATKYVKEIPLYSYKTLSFFAYAPSSNNNATIKLIFERESVNGAETAMELTLFNEAITLLQNSWKDVSLDMQHKKLYIGNNQVDERYYNLNTINNTVSPNKIKFEFTGDSSIYIDEIHLADAIWEITNENIFDIAWEKNAVLLEHGGIPVLANANITSNITTGVSTPLNTIENNSELALHADSSAQIDIFGLETGASLIFSTSNNEQWFSSKNTYVTLQSASHKVKTTPVFTLFKILSFQEDYRYLPESNGAKKIEEIGLDFTSLGTNAQINFSTEADRDFNAYNQDMKLQTALSLEGDSISYSLQTGVHAKQDGYDDVLVHNSYADSWIETSNIQFSNGYENANTRNIGLTINQSLHLPHYNIAPSFLVDMQNNYSNTNEIVNTSSDTIQLSLPFSLGSHTIIAALKKQSYSDSTRVQGSTYIQDAQYFFKKYGERSWAYTTIPLYDFFDTTILQNMQHSITNSLTTNIVGYTSEALLEWKRDYFSNSLDLFVPTNASIAFSRDIRTTTVDSSDILQIVGSLNFLSVNNFGRFGFTPFFTWYEQDEIIQSLKASYEFDNLSKNNTRLEFSGYNQTSFYFTNSDKLTILTEGLIDTDNEWNIKIDALWKRDGKSSFIVDSLLEFFPSLIETYIGFTRENSLYAGLSKTQEDEASEQVLQQFYGITHCIDIDINDYASIGLDMGSELFIEKHYFYLQNSASIVGKLRF